MRTAAPTDPTQTAEADVPVEAPSLDGLSAANVAAQTAAGLINRDTSRQRSDLDIVLANVFTYFNMLLGSLIGILLVLGIVDGETDHLQDAGFVGIIVAGNVIAGGDPGAARHPQAARTGRPHLAHRDGRARRPGAGHPRRHGGAG